MFGLCDSCGWPKFLIYQTNFGVRRRMCTKCCQAANQSESWMSLSPSQKAQLRNTGSYEYHSRFYHELFKK